MIPIYQGHTQDQEKLSSLGEYDNSLITSNKNLERERTAYQRMENSVSFMDFSNFENAFKCAEMISKARCIPKEFQGNPSDILVAIQYGHDLGLKPMASLQNVMIVNNRPTIYGDVVLALCMAHPDFIDCLETYDEENETAICIMKRKGREPVVRKFSKKMAQTAGLWGKSGERGVSAWVTFPERMLQNRARGFCIKDMWPDVLKGVSIFEDIKDIDHQNKKEINKLENNTAESMKERLLNKKNDSSLLLSEAKD